MSTYENENFKNFDFQLSFSFPIILAILPFFYIFPTIFVIFKIFLVYLRTIFGKNMKKYMDLNIFSIIVCSHFMNLLFFISDYLMYRLPSTGILTSWCYRNTSPALLTTVVFLTYYSAYTVLLFPSLLSLIRLFLIIYPNFHNFDRIFRWILPFIFIYPLFFTFFLIPSYGICKPLGLPYPYGSMMIYYSNSLYGIHNSPLILGNTVVWMIIGGAVNIGLLIKLGNFNLQKKNQSISSRSSSKNAEYSITITTISMLLSSLINCIFVISYLQLPAYINYITVVKPIGSDLETCISPWIFYLTHPIFEKKKDKKVRSAGSEKKSTVFMVTSF